MSLTRSERFARDGFVIVEELLRPDEVDWHRAVYERFLSGAIEVGRRRADLGAGGEPARPGVENITQILWPSDSLPELLRSAAYERALAVARERRALIVNFRPRAMVELERARGFDHGKDAPGRENRNPLTR
jgi:hypothetical protein